MKKNVLKKLQREVAGSINHSHPIRATRGSLAKQLEEAQRGLEENPKALEDSRKKLKKDEKVERDTEGANNAVTKKRVSKGADEEIKGTSEKQKGTSEEQYEASKGQKGTVMEEQPSGHVTDVEEYLKHHYELRFNLITEQTEFRELKKGKPVKTQVVKESTEHTVKRAITERSFATEEHSRIPYKVCLETKFLGVYLLKAKT